MLDRKLIRKDPDAVKEGIKRKGVEFDLDAFLGLDERLRSLLVEVERLKHERNDASQRISASKKRGEDCGGLITEMRDASNRIKEIDGEIKDLRERIDCLALGIPNLPHETVPFGTCPDHNIEKRRWGEIEEPPVRPLPHWEIGEKLGILDMSAGARLSGRGFVVLRGDGAMLARALVSFMLDLHRGQGYEELSVPYMVTRDCMVGTGQLPKLEDDMYLCERDDLFMIPTAEVPITNIHRESIIEGLPIKYTAYSPCFRREAGSYGQETKGLIRVHQFDKVEMVKLVAPETSYEELESLLTDATAVLEALRIPYRVIELCSMDLSFAAAKCYDIETYAPGIERWLEVSSCSNFEDFQARRANIRFRREEGGKPEFVHTLNGSGLALPRVLATIFELNQTPTGKIRVPEALSPFMGGKEYLEPAR